MKYLTEMPNEMKEYGIAKTLLVRKEMITLKHVGTEIFVRKSINIVPMLMELGMTLFDYSTFINERERKIFNFSRSFDVKDINDIIKVDNSLFRNLDLYKNGLNNCLVFDYDGVVGDPKFHKFYNYIVDKYGKEIKIFINSANPDITLNTLKSRGLREPFAIWANKGKKQKINRFIHISKKYDNTFLIDDEKSYLTYGWAFGLKTYIWDRKKEKIDIFNLYDEKFKKRLKMSKYL